MKKLWIALAFWLAFWFGCGWLAAGSSLSEYMYEFKPRMNYNNSAPLFTFRNHAVFSYSWGIGGGPFSLVVMAFDSDFFEHGFMWFKPKGSL